MPASPRLASTIRCSPTGCAVAIRSRSRIGLLAPRKSSPPGGLAALTTAATSYGVRPGCSPTKASIRRPSDAVGLAPLLQPGGVVGVGADGVVLGGDRRRPVGPATLRAHRDDLDVLAGQQPLHRAGQRRVPEHDDALDCVRRVRCRAAAGRCGSGSPPSATRCSARRAAASSRARPAAAPAAPRRPPPPPPSAGPAAGSTPAARSTATTDSPDRLGTGRRAGRRMLERSELSGSGTSGSSNWQLRWTGPPGCQAASRASGLGAVEVGEAGGVAEEADLVGGLVGAGAAEAGGAVGGHGDEGYAGMGRLEDSGVQVGRRRTRGRHDRDRPARSLGQPEGDEGGGALVDPGVQP